MSAIKDNGSFDMALDGAADFQQDFAYGAATKRCNCKKARCLKLYCVCFSAGVYCSGCACRECFNTVENQDIVHAERSKKLAASPGAFAPKVELKAEGEACHKKGCRCRRSRCVKKYCECFDAQVFCSASCRCESCLNLPKGESPALGAIPHIPGPALARGAAVDYLTRLPAGAGISGSAAAAVAAAAALNEQALAAANSGAADMDIDVGLCALDAVGPGLAAGREVVPAPVGALATHGSVPFAASGAGSFLLSLQAGSLGLPGLSFLENPDRAMGLLGRELGSGEADGPPGPRTDAAAAGGTNKSALPDGEGQLHADVQAEVKAIIPSAVVRRPPTSAFMFAEAEAILAAEEQPPAQAAGAAAAAAAATVIQAPPSTTEGADTLASAHLSAAVPGRVGTAPVSGEVKLESGAALLEGAGSIRVASASAGAAQETAADTLRPPPPVPVAAAADAPAARGTGSGAAGKPEEGKAFSACKPLLQTRNSSDPEVAVTTLPRGCDDGTGPAQAPDSLPLLPAGPAAVELPAGCSAGATDAAAADRAPAQPNDAAAEPLQQPGDHAAAPDGGTTGEATTRRAADQSTEQAAGDAGEHGGGRGTGEQRAPAQQGPRGGNGAAAAPDELSPMEAVLAAPTLLLEEPHRAEELAGALGLDLPQQLAARKAAHILRTLLCMAASAVRLTRSGAVGCSRWERSQGRGGAPSHAQPLASHHSLCAPSAGVTCGLKPGAGTAATSTLRAQPPGEPHDRQQQPQQQQQQNELEQEGAQAQPRQQQQQPLGLPPLSGCPPQPFQGAAAIPAAVAYRGAAGSSGQEGGASRWQDGGRHAGPGGRTLHLPPLQLPPLSFSCGSQGGGGGGAGASGGGHGGAGSAAVGAPGVVRLGHGSYLFSAAGRLTAPEASAASGSHVDGGDAQPPVALGPEASFSQAAPPPRGHARGSDALAGQRMLRRGSRVKRPNSLLADMELDDGLDDLDNRANLRIERRSHQDALPHGYSRRHHHHHLHYHHHDHHGGRYQPRFRSVSPTAEPPSPKRSRPSGPGGWRSAGRGRGAPAGGRRSRAGSWRGGADDEADEDEESYGGEESEAGPVGAARPGALSHYGAVAGDFPLPRAGGRRRDPSRSSGAAAWAMAAAIAARARHVADRAEAPEGSDDGGEADEEEDQGEEAEEREAGGPQRARCEEARAMSEEDSGNGASEMEAMQALFDLRAAVAAAPPPVAAAM